LPRSLEKRKEGKNFRIFFAEHILILPGSLKSGETGADLYPVNPVAQLTKKS